ncbi:hypothetical protein FOMPIDRAFT_1048766 [Fomitopsis schrenkii]|uniref:Transmembrane protein n=1 Tax=Fomitopsis schrenkii TaxID=2126942 RepID=S8E9L7_FOMSC|nr:hypothetical protein FOMPIDRAFT_1048766 [Fomitopsis schrenkii]
MRTFRRVEGSVAAVGRVNVLKQVLLRDTVVCFGLLCIVNVIGMATGHLDQWIEVMQSWVAILTSILLWRLALNLRETSGSTTGVDNSIEALDLSHTLADSEPSTASNDQSELSGFTTSGDKGWAIELGIMSSERVPDITVEM